MHGIVLFSYVFFIDFYIIFYLFFRISLRSFEKTFTGESLVNYLIEKNIATDKTEAISYGEDLLQGKKIICLYGLLSK